MNIFINSMFDDYYRKSPIKLVDVGASGGMQDNWKNAQRHLIFIGFEPDRRSFDKLQKVSSDRKRFINKALYKEKGVVDLYLTKKEEISSMFRPNKSFLRQFPEPDRFEIVEVSKAEVDSLDSQLEEHRIGDVDFIKLDTNGSELFILEGARKTLDGVFGLEVEVEFHDIYEGQPLFPDVDRFVRNIGFQLFDLKPRYWKRAAGKGYGGPKGQMIFADALYLVGPEGLKERLNRIQDDLPLKSKILRSMSVAILYGYIDYAAAIFEEHKRLFSAPEVESFYNELRKSVRIYTKIPYFRGKGKIARSFKGLYNLFRYYERGWSMAQEHLGNLE